MIKQKVNSDLEYYPPPNKRERPDNPRIEVVQTFESSNKTAKDTVDKGDQFDNAISIAAQVSKSRLRQSVKALASFHTRHTRSKSFADVPRWLIEQFLTLGYDDVKTHTYVKTGMSLNNVICVKPAGNNSQETIILSAHYDCIMQDHNNSTARAPGANDNATGVATVLEVARILKQIDLPRTIQFVCFSGEEQGLWGSTAYAAHVRQNNLNLHFLLNLDQVGFPSATKEVIIEQDLGNAAQGNDQKSQNLARTLAQIVQNRLGIPVKPGPIYSSDYMPFEARNYAVIGLYESGEYPPYHSDQDTPDKIDYDYLVNITKIASIAMFI